MPKFVLPSVAILCLGVAVCGEAGSGDSVPAGPKIVFRTASWDFGKMKRTEERSYEFVFRNEGDAVLNIIRVHSECGCTTAVPTDKKIAPGSASKLTVTFRAGEYAGEILRRIYVYTDDPATPEAQIRIKGRVMGPKIVFDATTWDFGRVKSADKRTGEFVFHNQGNEPLNVKNVETSCGCTAALVTERTIAPGKTGKIKVTFNARGYAGTVEKMVFVETDDPITPRIELRTKAAVDVPAAPKMEFDPLAIDQGLLIEGEDVTSEVTVRNSGELELWFGLQVPFVEYFVDGKPAAFPLEVKVAPGASVRVTIKSSTESRRGYMLDNYLISSNDSLKTTLSLIVTGYVVTKAELKQLYEKYKSILK